MLPTLCWVVSWEVRYITATYLIIGRAVDRGWWGWEFEDKARVVQDKRN